jgi:hypothetical protein
MLGGPASRGWTVGGAAAGGGAAGGVVVAVLFAASLTTYRDWADGPLPSFAGGILAAAAASGLVFAWGWVRAVPAGLVLCLALAAGAPLPAIHAIRVANQEAILQRALGPTVEYGRVLEPMLMADASLRLEPDELVLRTPAGSVGFVELRPPQPGPGRWGLPRALVTGGHARVLEEVAWRASIARDGSYFVLLDTGSVFVQATTWGLAIAVETPAAPRVQYQVAVPLERGAWHEWTFARGPAGTTLRRDDRVVWSTPVPAPTRFVRLGETRSDDQHGGTLRLRDIRYRRTLV